MTTTRVVITGASRGIGAAIARQFAAQGATLTLAARDVAALEQVAAECSAQGATCTLSPCDVTDVAQIMALRERALAAMGGVDVLVNNAGIAKSHKFIGHPDEIWEQLLAVNLTGVYQVSKVFVPDMVAQKSGRLIFIASIASKMASKYMAAYAASKHGVLGLVRALAVELVEHGITVNAVCPGYVDTPMTDSSIANIVVRTQLSPEKARAAVESMSPQKRLITADEVAALTVYLASEAARGITGQAINVDGGTVMY